MARAVEMNEKGVVVAEAFAAEYSSRLALVLYKYME